MQPLVRFCDVKGPKVRTSNFSVSGEGSALANAILLQTFSYFETKIIEMGEFCIGVASKGEPLNCHLNLRKKSWALHSQDAQFKVNDIIGCTFDMSQVRPILDFYINGVKLNKATRRDVKGDVYPAVSVSGGCHLQTNFGNSPFQFTPPPNFEGVIFSRDMI